jgi:fumarylacetoacetate (FAA) hydrolase
VLSEEWGVDLEAEVAVVTGDVPMGASVEQAASAIRLVMLVNDVSLRNLIPNELAKRALASTSRSRPAPFRRWR